MDMHTYTTDSCTNNPPQPAVIAAAICRERMETRRRKLVMMATFFIAAGIVAAISMTADGQDTNFEKMQMHAAFGDASVMRRMEAAAKDVARAKDLGSVRDPTYAKAYYQTYLPAKITQPEALPEISKLTQDAMKNLSSAQRSNNPGAAQMVAWLFSGMKRVAEGNYQPAARITALSILGRLDSKEGNITEKKPPVPYAQSFDVLLAQYQKESNSDGVRAAALQGLHRFVTIGFDQLNDQRKGAVITAMQDLLNSEAPAGRDRMAHAYLQRFAVDVLAVLEPTQGGKLGEQLISVSTEPNRHDLIALYSVSKLATVGNFGAAVDNPETLLSDWTVRAMRAFQYEYERLQLLDGIGQASSQPPRPEDTVSKKADAKTFVPGGYYGEDGDYEEEEEEDDGGDDGSFMEDDYEEEDEEGGFYMAAANPQPPEVVASRRRLNHVLQQIHRGVTGSTKAGAPSRPGGLLAAVKEDKKKRIQDLAEDMELLVTELNNPIYDDRAKFKSALLAQVETIKLIAGAAGEEAAAAYEKLPHGLNPYAKLAVLSGEPLEKAKETPPVVAPPVQPDEQPAAEPPAPAAAKPPIAAAASNSATTPAGT